MFVFCQDVPNCLFFDGSFTRNPNIWKFRSCTTCLVYGIISRIDFSYSSRLTESGCKDKDFFRYLPNFSETFFFKSGRTDWKNTARKQTSEKEENTKATALHPLKYRRSLAESGCKSRTF